MEINNEENVLNEKEKLLEAEKDIKNEHDKDIISNIKERRMKMKIKKRLSKNPKKTKKIITAVATMLLSMLLLVSVTYAWFTLTNKPKIEGFMLKVGTTGSLEISNSSTGTFGSSITFENMENLCLKPLTTMDGLTYHKPSSRDEQGVVKTVSAISAADLEKIINKSNVEGGYLIKKTFYLKATTDTKQNAEIKLVAGTKNSGTKASGTYVYNTGAGSSTKDGSAAVRIALNCGNKTPILEPNYDVTEAGENQECKLSGWSETNPKTIQQKSDGTFVTGSDGKSEVLFSIPANQATPVDMYIWLEGADKQCVNEIQGTEISYNFQFTSDDIE